MVQNKDYWRERLEQLNKAIEASEVTQEKITEKVELDQTRVGRLSRMDAMQAEAMDHAVKARRQHQQQRLKDALQRLDDDEFGYCTTCGELIAEARLELDPTLPTCVSCAG